MMAISCCRREFVSLLCKDFLVITAFSDILYQTSWMTVKNELHSFTPTTHLNVGELLS